MVKIRGWAWWGNGDKIIIAPKISTKFFGYAVGL